MKKDFAGFIFICTLALVAIVIPGLLLLFGVSWSTPSGSEPKSHPHEGMLVLCGSVVALVVTIWLGREKSARGSLPRLRHAIGMLTIFGLVVLSWSMYSWTWLSNEGESNSATLRNIGLAVAAVLTLIFVIWRERIASNQSSIARGMLALEQYQRGSDMLTSESEAVRIGGVGLLEKLGNQEEYRDLCLQLLRAVQRNAVGNEAEAVEKAIDSLRRKTCGGEPSKN